MRIKWLGHSCFLFTSVTGVQVLTDPFDSHVGYKLPSVEADIVTVSHGHGDHNFIQAVKGNPRHIGRPGVFEQGGIMISGISSFHDEVQGAKRGKNIIYIFDIDGLHICHCGDLGHIPSSEQLVAIGKVDILLVPVGSVFTINAAEAAKVVELIKPAVAIPMHFKTRALSFHLESVDLFLAAAGVSKQQAHVNKQEIDVEPGSLEELPKIIVLNYE